MRRNKKIFLSILIPFLLWPFAFGSQVNTFAATSSVVAWFEEDYSTAQATEVASSASIEVDQTVAGSFQGNLTGTILGEHQMLQFHSVSNSASFTRHLMCKDHTFPYYNPIEPTTIFRPSDTKAVCLTTVSIKDKIEFRWHYRGNSSKTWVSCLNVSKPAQIPDGKYREYHYEGHLLIAGHGLYYPRAYKVDVYLDGSFSFSEYFEITNGGLNSPRICEDIDENGQPVNMKSRFTIGVDTKAHHYVRFDKIAYFNDELECCHDFTTVWIQPNGSICKTYTGSFTDYKDTNLTWNYWSYDYTQDDYISINSSTPVGNWKVEVYLDSYYLNNTWVRYGPIATTTFIVGSEPVADWTFMVYLDADSNLEKAGIEIFLKMASVGFSPQVNIVVQMDRIPDYDGRYGNWTDCKRFNVTKGMTPTPGNATLHLGEANMGHPDTLKDFLNWTIYYYPANYYFLVLWGHGTGFRGVCFDITNAPDYLSLPELSQALSGLPAGLDVVFLDACSMGMAEVAYQIKDYANVLVAPEGLGYAMVDTNAAPYDNYLSSLASNSWMSPSAFAREVVNNYIAWCFLAEAIPNATMSATDLTQITSLIAAIDDFALKLEEKETPYHEKISLARNLTEVYQGPYAGESGYYIDLYHLTQLTYQYVPDEELRNTANQVITALQNVTIIKANKARPDSHGLSMFFPDKKGKYEKYGSVYEKTAFAIDTPWDESVKYHLSGYLLTIQTPYPSVPVKVDEDSYTTDADGKVRVFVLPDSYIVNVTTPVHNVTGPSSRGVFEQWNDDEKTPSRRITVTGPTTYTAHYRTEYEVTFSQSSLGTDFTETVVTVDGTGYNVTTLPVSFWWDAGSSHNFAFQSHLVVTPDGKRYVWISTSGLSSLQSDPIEVSTPGSVIGNYVTQYYLTVNSPHDSRTPTTGWFDSGTPITASVTSPWPPEAADNLYECTGWTGTGSVSASGTNTSVTFTIEEPSSITWNWKMYTPPWWENLLRPEMLQVILGLVGIVLTVALGGTAWIRTRRRKGVLKTLLDEIDEAYSRFKTNPRKCEEELSRLRNTVLEGLADGKIPEESYNIMDKRIDKYMEELQRAIEAPIEPAAIEVTEVLPGRITTGYGDLDNLLFGGIPENYAVILTSPSCDERDLLIKKFLETGAEKGEVTFYVTIDPGELGSLAEEYQSSFHLFICNPQADKIIKSLPNVFKLKGVEDLTAISIALTKAFRGLDEPITGPRRACIEVISDILLQQNIVQTRKLLTELITELKSRGFTTLAVMNPQMHPSEEVHAILDLFEGEINIYEKETERGLEKFLKIKKMYNQRYLESELPLKKEKLET